MFQGSFQFNLLAKDKNSKARVGRITTPHGTIETPAFVPVGTQATVKGLTPQDLKDIGVQVLFGNTYHLHLRPSEDVVQEFGGLGKFMGWNGPTMTDSGGFQVFSLGRKIGLSKGPTLDKVGPSGRREESEPRLVKITDDGVAFRSHIDGSEHFFSPEESIRIQKKLGADIILAFDECAPYPATYEYTKKAMERTHKWALKCLDEYFRCHPELDSGSHTVGGKMPKQVRHDKWKRQALYGIVQGGVYQDLREDSARFISSLPFDGIAIGGVSVGESKREMRNVLDWVVPLLPDTKPRHLLGIGEIDDILDSIERGVDTFDCVIPTRIGRTGFLFVSPPEGNTKNRFRIDITKTKFARDHNPPDATCTCYVCRNFTRGYLNHLFRTRELLAYRLASYHNVYFVVNLVRMIRTSILNQEFGTLKRKWLGE